MLDRVQKQPVENFGSDLLPHHTMKLSHLQDQLQLLYHQDANIKMLCTSLYKKEKILTPFGTLNIPNNNKIDKVYVFAIWGSLQNHLVNNKQELSITLVKFKEFSIFQDKKL